MAQPYRIVIPHFIYIKSGPFPLHLRYANEPAAGSRLPHPHIKKHPQSGVFFMAESTGLEPAHPVKDDGLAIRCITTLPTLRRMDVSYQSF